MKHAVFATLLGALAAPAAMAGGVPDPAPLFWNTTPVHAYEYGRPDAPLGPKTRALSFREVDRNRNGLWEPAEMRAVFDARVTRDLILSFDANADGCISLLEVRAFDDNRTGGPDGLLKERVRG